MIKNTLKKTITSIFSLTAFAPEALWANLEDMLVEERFVAAQPSPAIAARFEEIRTSHEELMPSLRASRENTDLLRLTAQNGNAEAMFHMGLHARFGSAHIAQSYQDAAVWWILAARAGYQSVEVNIIPHVYQVLLTGSDPTLGWSDKQDLQFANEILYKCIELNMATMKLEYCKRLFSQGALAIAQVDHWSLAALENYIQDDTQEAGKIAYRLGIHYSRVANRREDAYRVFCRGDALNSVTCRLERAIAEYYGKGTAQDIPGARQRLESIIAAPGVHTAIKSEASLFLAILLKNAFSDENPGRVRQLIEEVGEKNLGALALKGEMYLEGYGFEADPAIALEFFQRVFDGGHPSGPEYLGRYYEEVAQNYEEAIRFYTMAVAQDDPAESQIFALKIAKIYDRQGNMEDLLAWLRNPLLTENGWAQTRLGELILAGQVQGMDPRDALPYFVQGMEQQHGQAFLRWVKFQKEYAPETPSTEILRNLRLAIAHSVGAAQAEAFVVLEERAETEKEACILLARIYEQGLGVDRDEVQMARWIAKASQCGEEGDEVILTAFQERMLSQIRGTCETADVETLGQDRVEDLNLRTLVGRVLTDWLHMRGQVDADYQLDADDLDEERVLTHLRAVLAQAHVEYIDGSPVANISAEKALSWILEDWEDLKTA